MSLPDVYGQRIENLKPEDQANHCDVCRKRPKNGTVRMFTNGVWICDNPECHRWIKDDWNRHCERLDKARLLADALIDAYEDICDANNLPPWDGPISLHWLCQDLQNCSRLGVANDLAYIKERLAERWNDHLSDMEESILRYLTETTNEARSRSYRMER